MRTISGDLIENDYKIVTPFRMLISGSSGTGKTTFIENLLQSNRIDKDFSTVYYCYPYNLGDPPVEWHETLKCNVQYLTHLPDLRFFDFIEPIREHLLKLILHFSPEHHLVTPDNEAWI